MHVDSAPNCGMDILWNLLTFGCHLGEVQGLQDQQGADTTLLD